MDVQDLRDRLREDYEATAWPVLLTAIPLAVALGYGVGAAFGSATAVFLVLVVVGVLVPHAHEEYWPIETDDRPWQHDAAWTAKASVIATALFVAGYLLAALLLGDSTAAVVAFLLTAAAGWWLLGVLGDGRTDRH